MADIQTLIARIKKQDDLAFEELYELTKRSVYAMIYSIVQNRAMTEDLMQDTYIKMLQSIHHYDGRVKFITWLVTIAKNLAIDSYRKEKRLLQIDLQTEEYMLPTHMDSTEKQMESDAYLAILSNEEREIVLMKIVGRLTHNEISQLVHKPLGTVMWIYNQAIKRMQTYAKEE